MGDYKDATSPRDRTKTKQDYRTPPEFIRAVEKRFGIVMLDLAASDGHEVKPLLEHITPEQDSLKVPWPTRRHASGLYFLNPPYADLEPWAAKCAKWRAEANPGVAIGLLVLASVDARWWAESVRGHAIAYAINRIRFIGATETYPKPLAFVVYDPRYYPTGSGLEFWDWRAELKR